MAEFLIRVLKWLAALATAYFLLFLLLFLVILGIGAAFQPEIQTVPEDSVLVLDLRFNLTDQPKTDDPATLVRDALAGEFLPTAHLRQVLKGLEEARKDGDVRGLLITGNLIVDGYGGSFAALRELREAIVAFGREKPVWAQLELESLRDYYVKSAATEVIADPHAMLDFRGLQAERLYFGEAFERLGIELQVEAVGDYKTAYESFLKGEMSEAERVQITDLLGDMWDSIVEGIAASRGMAAADLDKVADTELNVYAEEVIETGMADRMLARDELVELLINEVGVDASGDTFRQFDFIDYTRMSQDPLMQSLELMSQPNRVAVLYVEGILIDGESEDGVVGSDTLIRHLRNLRKDDNVKAVVLRMNSPGGSGTASSKVVREIELTNAEKPVVVSMGGIAASAGYMMSAAGDYVFTEPATITGSIGVVSMLPNIAGLAEKLSINFQGVGTHKFSGAYSLGRSKTEEEMRQVRAIAEQYYEEFVQSVAANREMDLEEVLRVASGRVWSGTAAVELDLADEIGGLEMAIQRAADLAGIGDAFSVSDFPPPKSLEQRIQEFLSGTKLVRSGPRVEARARLKAFENEIRRLSLLNDPYGQYAILPYTLKIN